MPSYTLFRINPESRQRMPGEWLEAADVDEALEIARKLVADWKYEIWLQGRLVSQQSSERSHQP